MNKNGNLMSTDKEKGEVLNNIFALVFTGNLFHHPSPFDGDHGDKAPLTVTKDQVCSHLRNVNIHESMGPDEMHPRVLRELAGVVAKTVSLIFERSGQSGEVPSDWKKGNIAPIFKKGRNEDPGNYQLLSHLCAWADHETEPPTGYVKAHGGQGGDIRQPVWLHEGQVLPDQPSGIVQWNDYIGGQGKSYRCCLSGLL